MKITSVCLLVLTIASVHGAFVPTVPGLSDDDLFDQDDCRPNETFRECGHAAICDWTCENREEPYITCPPICVRRCICNDGYVRHGNGTCIDGNQCENQTDY